MTTHLVTGVGGQDGVLLARLLLARGERVVGTLRPGAANPLASCLADVELLELDVRDTDEFARLLDQVRPQAVHNLAGMSSVGESWGAREETRAVNATAVEDMLQVLRRLPGPRPLFVQASSAEIFGRAEGPGEAVDERTPLAPLSPYAEAKATAHRAVQQAREEGLAATNVVLFGHTSVLQPRRFVLPTVAHQAAEVALGRRDAVMLRDLTTRRDWGSAGDIVRAFALAASAPAGDYVIGTGELHPLTEITGWALAAGGAATDAVIASGEPGRPGDFDGLRADLTTAAAVLGWSPTVPLRNEIARMVAVSRERILTGVEHDPSYLCAESA